MYFNKENLELLHLNSIFKSNQIKFLYYYILKSKIFNHHPFYQSCSNFQS
jgi:hypothetical protein